MNKIDIFIASPLTSFNPSEYTINNKRICELVSWTREYTLYKNVFYAGENKNKKINFDDAESAIKMDLEAIRSCKYFVLIYPIKTITSAFVEIGYAMALQKKVHIFVKKREDLPFILQNSDNAYKNICIHEYLRDSMLDEDFKTFIVSMK